MTHLRNYGKQHTRSGPALIDFIEIGGLVSHRADGARYVSPLSGPEMRSLISVLFSPSYASRQIFFDSEPDYLPHNI